MTGNQLEETMKKTMMLVMTCCVMATGVAQTPNLNPGRPKVGTAAPVLSLEHVLQAPVGTKVNWPAMRGKVVVLEFWATWCAPCIGEIPVLNSLASSLDPAKVQFVSVDDEAPEVVEAFLKRKPIKGWVGIDTSGKTFARYGVVARPATFVIGPDGRVVSDSVPPQNLKREKLLALAQGKKTQVNGDADAAAEAKVEAATKAAFAEQIGPTGDAGESLFALDVTAAEMPADGKAPDTHMMMLGPGKMDITNADVKTLVMMGLDVPASRMTTAGTLPKGIYNLHVVAPGVDRKVLNADVETAIAASTGVKITRTTADTDAFVMTALPDGKRGAPQAQSGFAAYDAKAQVLQCLYASMDQIAAALGAAVGKPVVNETGIDGSYMAQIPMAAKDEAAANEALGKALGVTLTEARRPIETVVLTGSVTTAVVR
jgi:uncharacterized protein (TIGR03435 family)